MSFKLLGGGSDLNTVVNDMNGNILELKNKEVTEIFKDATGTARVLLGKGQGGFYGMKVSKPGFDVFTASNEQLVFNSSQNVFKIVGTGTVTIGTVTDTNTSTTIIPHGLNFTPIPLAFISGGGFYYPLPYADNKAWSAGGTTGVKFMTLSEVYADSTNLYITYTNASGITRSGFTYKYYFLQESAN